MCGCRVQGGEEWGTANNPNNGRAAAGWAQLGDEKCSWSNQLQLGRQLKRKSGVLRVFAVINCRCAAAAKWSTALQCCLLQCCSHTRPLTRGHRGAVFNNVNVEMYFHVFKELFTAFLCSAQSKYY